MFLVFRKYSLITLLMIFAILLSSASSDTERYKVIKVIDGDTVYLDFNKDGIPQQEDTPFQHIRKRFHRNGFASTTETGSQVSKTLDCSLCQKVRVKGIDTFEVKPTKYLFRQMAMYGLSQQEALGLGYLGKEFAKKNLLNKYVRAEYTSNSRLDNTNRNLMTLYYDGKIYDQELLKAGLAIVYEDSNIALDLKKYENLEKVKQNALQARSFNLVLLNKKNGKYHKPDCQYGVKATQAELVEKPLNPLYSPSNCCFNRIDIKETYIKPENLVYRHKINQKEIQKFIDEKYIEPGSYIRIFFVYPGKEMDHSGNSIQAGKELAKIINETKDTLDIALFGFENQPEILKALLNAQKRGVKIRVVFDMNYMGRNTYPRTQQVIDKLEKGTVRTDYEVDFSYYTQSLKSQRKNIIPGALMHNKYVISDMQKVWTGSTNVSDTGTGGYNANISGIIKSKIVAWLYTKDFEYMYVDNKFHSQKPSTYLQEIKLADGSEIDVFFLPGRYANDLGILPMMNEAKDYLYGLTFFYTNNKLIYAMIDAYHRGVDVKVIIDAAEANNLHRKKHYLMRKEGIPVKSENFGGKMHCKTFFSDDRIFSFGSMNATTTAEYYNDENLVIVKNPELTKKVKVYFEQLWAQIPDKWLFSDPSPEGPDSPGSCSDGIDNDHNGFRDNEDPKCNYRVSPVYR